MPTSVIEPRSAEATPLLHKRLARSRPLWDPVILKRALKESFIKLNPSTLAKNPVMFVVEVGAAMTTCLLVHDAITGLPDLVFTLQITIWLWFTVLFASFAEAMAEARGKAQADALRKTKTDAIAKRLTGQGRVEACPA